MSTTMPRVRAVARRLRSVNAELEGETDVRLQVYEDGAWAIRVGDPSYDLDHHGFWGCGTLYGPRGARQGSGWRMSRDLPRYVCSKCGKPLPTPLPDCAGWTCDLTPGCRGLPASVSATAGPDATVVRTS